MAFLGQVTQDASYTNLSVKQTTVVDNALVTGGVSRVIVFENGRHELSESDTGSLVMLNLAASALTTTLVLPPRAVNGSEFTVIVTTSGPVYLSFESAATINLLVTGLIQNLPNNVASYYFGTNSETFAIIDRIATGTSASFKFEAVGGKWALSGNVFMVPT